MQIQNGQARVTLPKRWVEDQNLEDKDEIELKDMKRDSGLKLKNAKE